MSLQINKNHVDKKAIEYLKKHWETPPRQQGGAVHARYTQTHGIGETTSLRPKMRKYLKYMTSQPNLTDCKAAELLLHFRLECLPLNAFHRYERNGESVAARQLRELCPSCNQHPETPTHFLLECPAYSAARSLPHIAACISDVPAGPNAWRTLLDYQQMASLIYAAWNIERAALTGRGANGGNSAPQSLRRYRLCWTPISLEMQQQLDAAVLCSSRRQKIDNG
jgi:hypothetical protein